MPHLPVLRRHHRLWLTEMTLSIQADGLIMHINDGVAGAPSLDERWVCQIVEMEIARLLRQGHDVEITVTE